MLSLWNKRGKAGTKHINLSPSPQQAHGNPLKAAVDRGERGEVIPDWGEWHISNLTREQALKQTMHPAAFKLNNLCFMAIQI